MERKIFNDPNPEMGSMRHLSDSWITGTEGMTAVDAAYLQSLADEHGEEVDTSLSKFMASSRIAELEERG
jgi:hypothetical protein